YFCERRSRRGASQHRQHAWVTRANRRMAEGSARASPWHHAGDDRRLALCLPRKSADSNPLHSSGGTFGGASLLLPAALATAGLAARVEARGVALLLSRGGLSAIGSAEHQQG